MKQQMMEFAITCDIRYLLCRGKKKETGTNTEIISIDKHIDKMLFRANILYKGEAITVELEGV
jgi:ribosomal protein S8E